MTVKEKKYHKVTISGIDEKTHKKALKYVKSLGLDFGKFVNILVRKELKEKTLK